MLKTNLVAMHPIFFQSEETCMFLDEERFSYHPNRDKAFIDRLTSTNLNRPTGKFGQTVQGVFKIK
jgi:hypothetical protein